MFFEFRKHHGLIAEVAGFVGERTGLRRRGEAVGKKEQNQKRANLGMCCDRCKVSAAENGLCTTTLKIRTLESEA
jgi:hypothetical protein